MQSRKRIIHVDNEMLMLRNSYSGLDVLEIFIVYIFNVILTDAKAKILAKYFSKKTKDYKIL